MKINRITKDNSCVHNYILRQEYIVMEQKLISGIKKITLNSATFKKVEIAPTQINIFYGNNGTGKSTIARAIKSNNELEWKAGKSNIDYSIMT